MSRYEIKTSVDVFQDELYSKLHQACNMPEFLSCFRIFLTKNYQILEENSLIDVSSDADDPQLLLVIKAGELEFSSIHECKYAKNTHRLGADAVLEIYQRAEMIPLFLDASREPVNIEMIYQVDARFEVGKEDATLKELIPRKHDFCGLTRKESTDLFMPRISSSLAAYLFLYADLEVKLL